jgi:hypothetical protein
LGSLKLLFEESSMATKSLDWMVVEVPPSPKIAKFYFNNPYSCTSVDTSDHFATLWSQVGLAFTSFLTSFWITCTWENCISGLCLRHIFRSQDEAFLLPFLPPRWEIQRLPLSSVCCSHGQGREGRRPFMKVTQVLSNVSLKNLFHKQHDWTKV